MTETRPSSENAVQLTVNGKAHPWQQGGSVADLLAELSLSGKRIAVERNGEIVPRSQHSSTTLAHGDTLEIVVAVGGG